MIKHRQKLGYSIVLELLERFNPCFIPRLDTEKDICSYSKKLSDKAYFEIYEEDYIIGYIAYYLNSEDGLCFITSLAVDAKYRGQGIAKQMLSGLIDSLPDCISTVKLEVAKVALPAYNLYRNFDFSIEKGNDIKYTMSKLIKK